MSGPLPKPANLRQRQNRAATRATLGTEAESATNEVPDLFVKEGGWHPLTRDWWTSVWRSPMASEYLDADVKGGLFRLAMLVDDFWTADSRAARANTSIEIRQVGMAFGLSPIDRRRLQWEVAKGDEAEQKTRARKEQKPPAAPVADPRNGLKAVS